MIAIGVHRWDVRESQRDDEHARMKHVRWEVFGMPADLSEPPRLLTDGDEDVGGFYLMSGAGYLVAIADFGGEHIEVKQYFLDGGSRTVLHRRDLHSLAPLGEPRRL